MFDLDFGKLVVIGIIALIAIGPKELPAVLRTVGQYMAKIRRMAAEFQGQFQEAMREAEMADMKKHLDDINDAAKGLTSNLDPLGPSLHGGTSALEDKPASPPPPAPSEAPGPPAAEAQGAAVPVEQVANLPVDVQVPLPEPVAPASASDFITADTVPRETPEARDRPA
jgi:sec-independent protein translocase protein TatB